MFQDKTKFMQYLFINTALKKVLDRKCQFKKINYFQENIENK